MSDWMAKGCKNCQRAVQSGFGEPLLRLMQSTSQDATLYKCQKCGACWLDTDGEARVIPEEDARRDFPEAFADDPQE